MPERTLAKMPEGPEYSRPRNAWRDSEERAFAAGWGGCREAERDSVARSFAEGSAVVVTAEEFVGLGVDGYEFAVAPDSWVVFVGYGEAIDGVADGFELVGHLRRNSAFRRVGFDIFWGLRLVPVPPAAGNRPDRVDQP